MCWILICLMRSCTDLCWIIYLLYVTNTIIFKYIHLAMVNTMILQSSLLLSEAIFIDDLFNWLTSHWSIENLYIIHLPINNEIIKWYDNQPYCFLNFYSLVICLMDQTIIGEMKIKDLNRLIIVNLAHLSDHFTLFMTNISIYKPMHYLIDF